MYRAVALLWKDDKFQLKRKLPRERWIWCLLQHKLCNWKIWVASFHLPHNQSLLECERQFQEFVSLPPRNLQACVIMSDFNVPFQWRRCGGEIKPGTSNAKWQKATEEEAQYENLVFKKTVRPELRQMFFQPETGPASRCH